MSSKRALHTIKAGTGQRQGGRAESGRVSLVSWYTATDRAQLFAILSIPPHFAGFNGSVGQDKTLTGYRSKQ